MISQVLSPDTQAILLLTAPLIAGRANGTANLLTPTEYTELAQCLRERGWRPADLLEPDAFELASDCCSKFDRGRLELLLKRGFLLSQAVDRWQTRAIWVISRADPEYPKRLKSRLKEESPPLLYGCGERELLDAGGLAVVGSRHVNDALVAYAEDIGRLAAQAGRSIVSGGAKGIDQAAMRGALDFGGTVTGVLADSLERAALHRENRNRLLGGTLVLISPYDPNAGFQVGHAMKRNKVIYALADAALVVNSDFNKGGTWTGAVEQLDKLRLVRVYVRSTGEPTKGLDALRKKGAVPWPNPENVAELDEVLSAGPDDSVRKSPQGEISFNVEQRAYPQAIKESPPGYASHPSQVGASGSEAEIEPADELFGTVRTLVLGLLTEPRTSKYIASALRVNQRQAEEWLGRLVASGLLEKRGKPACYVVRDIDLFRSPDQL